MPTTDDRDKAEEGYRREMRSRALGTIIAILIILFLIGVLMILMSGNPV